MSIYQAFDSLTITQQQSRGTTKVSFYSSEGREELERYIDLNFPPGYGSLLGGYVDTVTYQQRETIWYANVSIWWEHSSIAFNTGRVPLHHSLRAIRLSLPLSKKQGYKTKWDHFLWQRTPVSSEESEDESSTPASLPTEWDNAQTDAPFSVSGVYYRWTKNGSELDGAPKNGHVWKCVAAPTKPGVESWDFHTYQISEFGEYRSEREAAWVTNMLLDRVRDKPLLGDFGLSTILPGTGWEWKCDDANVENNGKRWIASLVWTLSGDANGWDRDLYDVSGGASSGSSGSGSSGSGSSGSGSSGSGSSGSGSSGSGSESSGSLGGDMNWIEIP
jgi:hypothetical protein